MSLLEEGLFGERAFTTTELCLLLMVLKHCESDIFY